MVAEPKKLKGKTTNEIIEQIHETFYTEVDRLLYEAKISHSLDTDKQDLIDKCNRLKALGFTNTKEVQEAEIEISRLEQLSKENEEKTTLIEAITYFSFRYPQYKFITEKSVEKICKKYNLVYGAIDRYIGTVPDKNLKHIEDFKVLNDDECFLNEYISYGFGEERRFGKKYITHTEHERNKNFDNIRFMTTSYKEINMKSPLEIAAPIKDFNMKGLEVKNYKISKIEIPDPIVLKPVIFKSQKHYLIVTAWGLEAGDELVVNHNHN